MISYKSRKHQLDAKIRDILKLRHFSRSERKEIRKAMQNACTVGQCAERDWTREVLLNGFDQPTIYDDICKFSIRETLRKDFVKYPPKAKGQS